MLKWYYLQMTFKCYVFVEDTDCLLYTLTLTLALNPAHTLPLPPGNGRSLLCTRACYTVYTNFLQFLWQPNPTSNPIQSNPIPGWGYMVTGLRHPPHPTTLKLLTNFQAT